MAREQFIALQKRSRRAHRIGRSLRRSSRVQTTEFSFWREPYAYPAYALALLSLTHSHFNPLATLVVFWITALGCRLTLVPLDSAPSVEDLFHLSEGRPKAQLPPTKGDTSPRPSRKKGRRR